MRLHTCRQAQKNLGISAEECSIVMENESGIAHVLDFMIHLFMRQA